MSAFFMTKHIVLVGMMGVGKTTLGRRLAHRLDRPFVDTDDAIADSAGMDVPEIFRVLGEAAFRSGELKVIKRLLTEPPSVISTGGGAFITDEIRHMILQDALAIWLTAPVHVLLDRMRHGKDRPLLNGVDRYQTLKTLQHVRDPVYAQAPIHISTADKSWSTLLDECITAIDARLSDTLSWTRLNAPHSQRI